MKRLFFSLLGIITILSSIVFAFAANQSVQVSAVVGIINHSPVILSVNPHSDPKILGVTNIQNYSLYFQDDEKDTISYTITPLNGYTNPISGTISTGSYDSASGAYITFTYLSPATPPAGNLTTVTITLNDGANLVNKDLHLYIY